MANNITNIQSVNPDTLEFQNYQSADSGLISSFTVNDIVFTSDFNSVEYHILDSNKNLITSDYNFLNYSILDGNITITPENDLSNLGFTEGQYYTLYHFTTPLLNSTVDNKYFISEISSDRTELRLSSNTLTSQSITDGYNNFISQYAGQNYYPDFYLNFGDNDLVIANNVLLDNNTILIKLYESLPPQFDVKSELWVINKLADSISYFIELITVFTNTENIINLKGPNLNINLKNQINNSTDYINYTGLQTSSSLSNQLNNILNNKSIRLNIDYTDYNNFIHFSSAETRLENFYYKLTLIEQYKRQYVSSSSSPSNYYLTSSQNVYLTKIKEIEEGLDGYEYHLYYESGSTSWPKSNTIQPYTNYASTSSQGTTWLTGRLTTASLYDSENKDALINGIPLYLKEDPSNAPYELFIEMLGQNFDTLYLYYGEITNKYSSDNRIDYGASKDVVSDILRDFGVKIYQNNFSTTDLYSSFLGITSNLGLLPTTGSELITNYVTASNEVIPLDDANTELYKRIYHNLPLLFKKKGTVEGLRLLINTYGIPDTILRISEFGGKNKINANDWDQFQDQFNYEFFTTSSGYLEKSIPSGIDSSLLSTVEFRFKSTGIPIVSGFSQSLASFEYKEEMAFNVVLEYSGSGYVSSSHAGSIPNVNNQYGTLKLIQNKTGDLETFLSASIYLPFFNEDWWSVLVTTTNDTSSLYTKNKIYSGYDGNKIGFQASSSVAGVEYWINYANGSNFHLSYPTNKTIVGKIYTPFSGSFQELRFYNTQISQSVFDDYVMNPYSIESNQLSGSQSSYNSLIFRAPLGSVLDISGSTRNSIHPQTPVTTLGTNDYTLGGSYSFLPNTEVMYLDQFPAGIKNIVSNKIKIENTILPGGNVLSANRSLQQNYIVSESYTRDTNYAEISFSPQNEINDDITSQLGYFNIGDYIGDPRQLVNTNATFYPDFNKVRDDYFLKYSSSYNVLDYVRIIKYFDNSLFKLIKDFTPARVDLASGVVIKQHILERNRYSPAQVDYEFQDYSGSVKSFPLDYSESVLYKITSQPAGVFPDLHGSASSEYQYPGAINITQSWDEAFSGPTGLSFISHTSQEEFYTGIFSGSTLIVSTQSLNPDNPFLDDVPKAFLYDLKFFYDVPLFDILTVNSTYTNNNFLFGNSPNPNFGRAWFTPDHIAIFTRDNNGIDNTFSLRSLNSIRVVYSNGSAVDYIINVKSEYSGYFIFNITNNTLYYPADNTILDYRLSASLSPPVYFLPTGSGGAGKFSGIESAALLFGSSSLDPLGYYTSSFKGNAYNPNAGGYGNVTASIYTLKDIINVPLQITITGDVTSYYSGGPTSLWYARVSICKMPWDARTTVYPFSNNTVRELGYASPWNNPYLNQISGAIELQANFIPPTLTSVTGSFNFNIIDTNPAWGDIYFAAIMKPPFANFTSPITASNCTLTITPLSASQTHFSNSILLNPYLDQPFEGTNYDVLYGSVDKIAPSQFFEKIDYLDYNTIDEAFRQKLLSGSVPKADVKDYYYEAKRHIYPRYIGSKNTSDDFNTSSISQSNSLQSSSRIPLSPSRNQGVAFNYDTLLYEFSSINTPYELPFLSKININQILNTDTTSSATIIASSDPNFIFTKEKIKNNDLLKASYYNTSFNNLPFILNTKGIVSPTSFYTWSPSLTAYGFLQSGSNVFWNYMFSEDFTVSSINTLNNSYVLGPNVPIIQLATDISQSLLKNESWYITLYTGSLTYPLSPSSVLTPMLNGQIISASTTINATTGNYSVFKVISSSIESRYGGDTLNLHLLLPTATGQFDISSSFPSPGQNSGILVGKDPGYGGNPFISALLWKDDTNGGGILIDKLPLNVNSQGNFTTPSVLPFIQDNLDYIAQNFGNKPKN